MPAFGKQPVAVPGDTDGLALDPVEDTTGQDDVGASELRTPVEPDRPHTGLEVAGFE
jgi:hypothetical protein